MIKIYKVFWRNTKKRDYKDWRYAEDYINLAYAEEFIVDCKERLDSENEYKIETEWLEVFEEEEK